MSVTIKPEKGNTELFDKAVSDLQSDIVIANKSIKGNLKYIDDYSAAGFTGGGNYLALKYNSSNWDGYTSVKVGLEPSYSGGLVEIINDPDKNGVFKITNNTQKFKVVATNGKSTKTDTYDLTDIVLEGE